jgi:hypothetical protein
MKVSDDLHQQQDFTWLLSDSKLNNAFKARTSLINPVLSKLHWSLGFYFWQAQQNRQKRGCFLMPRHSKHEIETVVAGFGINQPLYFRYQAKGRGRFSQDILKICSNHCGEGKLDNIIGSSAENTSKITSRL